MKSFKVHITAVLIFAGILFVPGSLFPQQGTVALNIGFNCVFTRTGDESTGSYAPLPGVMTGLSLQKRATGILSLRTGACLSIEGNLARSVGNLNIYNGLLYLDIPALIVISPLAEEKTRPQFIAGTSASILIMARNQTGKINDIRACNFPVIIGLGTGGKRFSIEILYKHSLINYDISDYNNSIKMSTVSVCLVISFNKKKKK